MMLHYQKTSVIADCSHSKAVRGLALQLAFSSALQPITSSCTQQRRATPEGEGYKRKLESYKEHVLSSPGRHISEYILHIITIINSNFEIARISPES